MEVILGPVGKDRFYKVIAKTIEDAGLSHGSRAKGVEVLSQVGIPWESTVLRDQRKACEREGNAKLAAELDSATRRCEFWGFVPEVAEAPSKPIANEPPK